MRKRMEYNITKPALSRTGNMKVFVFPGIKKMLRIIRVKNKLKNFFHTSYTTSLKKKNGKTEKERLRDNKKNAHEFLQKISELKINPYLFKKDTEKSLNFQMIKSTIDTKKEVPKKSVIFV